MKWRVTDNPPVDHDPPPGNPLRFMWAGFRDAWARLWGHGP